MAGDWLKMRRSLLADPKVVRISSACNADRYRTIGGLFAAWCLFDEQTDDGTLEGYTPEVLDELIQFPGMAAAMAAVGWLEIGDNSLTVLGFEQHNGKSAKRRAQESVRKSSARNADKKRSREEKRREENINAPPKAGEKSQVRIPKSLQGNAELAAAVDRWFGYLQTQHPDKAILPDSPQAEALWQRIAREGADKAAQAIEHAMSENWRSIRFDAAERRQNSRNGSKTTDASPAVREAWQRVCAYVRRHDPKYESAQILAKLTPAETAAVRAVGGLVKISDRDRFTKNDIERRFVAAFEGNANVE